MDVVTVRYGRWLFLLSFLCGVNSRYVEPSVDFRYDVDLVASAAEPRPIFVENVANSPGLPLPLVYSVDVDSSTSGNPESVASEKVEKVLKPALAFSYTNEKTEEEINEKPTDSNGEHSTHGVRSVRHDNDHAAKHQHGGDFEKGGGKEFHSDHKGEFGEEGHKEYDGHHHHKKEEKGHHDKGEDEKHYGEHGGHEKDNHHDSGYFGEHHKEEGGHKGSDFSEHGEHNKGHSTKGSHSIRKKEEFDKKTEFFDEDDESGEFEKHGGYHHEDSYKKGGHKKGDYDKGGTHKDHYGEESEHEKATYHKEETGHDEEAGHDNHHAHHSKHGKEEGEKTGKKWAYKHGHGDGGHEKKEHGNSGSHSHVAYQVHELPPKHQDAKPVDSNLKPISVDREHHQDETVAPAHHHVHLVEKSPNKEILIEDAVTQSSEIIQQTPTKAVKAIKEPDDITFSPLTKAFVDKKKEQEVEVDSTKPILKKKKKKHKAKKQAKLKAKKSSYPHEGHHESHHAEESQHQFLIVVPDDGV